MTKLIKLIKKIKRLFFKAKSRGLYYGIKFGDGSYVGQVASLSDNPINGRPAKTTYYRWNGRNWIVFDPGDCGEIYTFHYKQLDKQEFVTRPGEFPYKMHPDDYQRYQDAILKP